MAEPKPRDTTIKEHSRVERSDESLIWELQRGSASAFTELFVRYRDPIFGFLHRQLSDPARAEEFGAACVWRRFEGALRLESTASKTTGSHSGFQDVRKGTAVA